jgi:hypothetical protein
MHEDKAGFETTNEDYWYKIVEFFQHNSAVIESEDSGFKILFFNEFGGGIFDSIEFDSLEDAKTALKSHGFTNYNEDQEGYSFIIKPHDWGVIESGDSGFKILFFDECGGGIFDSIEFNSLEDAKTALKRNGFKNYNEDQAAHDFIAKPKAPFRGGAHLNNSIYSSGRFWC